MMSVAQSTVRRRNRGSTRLEVAIIVVVLGIFVLQALEQVEASCVLFGSEIGLLWALIATALHDALLDRKLV